MGTRVKQLCGCGCSGSCVDGVFVFKIWSCLYHSICMEQQHMPVQLHAGCNRLGAVAGVVLMRGVVDVTVYATNTQAAIGVPKLLTSCCTYCAYSRLQQLLHATIDTVLWRGWLSGWTACTTTEVQVSVGLWANVSI